MKIALVHDWLVNRRGAEYYLEILCEILPQADIFTLIYDPDKAAPVFKGRAIRTSFIEGLPFAKGHFRYYLPLFPKAIEGFDLGRYDLIVSINHCVAKGIKVRNGTRHICLCLTPMRYIWVYPDEYFGLFKRILSPVIKYLRSWDRATAGSVDRFFAISNHIRNRIKRCYERDSDVLFPPVDVNYFSNLSKEPQKREDFYLLVSELVPYKRTELAISAFNELGRPLRIIGDGSCKGSLVRMAKENITFLDWQPRDALKEYYSRARALIYPQKEDFGLVAVEAQSAGCPVIAYKKGGALDTVIEDKTGVFFSEKTKGSLVDGIRRFEGMSLEENDIVENAKRFDKEIFKRKFREIMDAAR